MVHEEGRILKEIGMAYFKVLSKHLSAKTEANHKISQDIL